MARYLGGKVFYTLVSLFVLASATFVLMKVIPGNPFMSEKTPPAIQKKIMEHYGLNKPVLVQYKDYMLNLVQGDLGISMKNQHQSVARIIKSSFSKSLRLGIVAIVFSVIAGVTLGTIASLRHRKWLDRGSMIVAVIGLSVPNFVLAVFLQWLLGEKLGWLRVYGLSSPFDYIMPTLALSALPIAFIARLTRSGMLEALQSDYIKTAKAKGMSTWAITTKHALRNALLPVITYLGPLTANIITGSVVVENIFGISGLGKFFVQSVYNRDYTLIMGITIFYGVILMLARLATDIAYVFVDPRIKLAGGKEGA